jgi:hypothetical protein
MSASGGNGPSRQRRRGASRTPHIRPKAPEGLVDLNYCAARMLAEGVPADSV